MKTETQLPAASQVRVWVESDNDSVRIRVRRIDGRPATRAGTARPGKKKGPALTR